MATNKNKFKKGLLGNAIKEKKQRARKTQNAIDKALGKKKK